MSFHFPFLLTPSQLTPRTVFDILRLARVNESIAKRTGELPTPINRRLGGSG
jgi:hypothetical protein